MNKLWEDFSIKSLPSDSKIASVLGNLAETFLFGSKESCSLKSKGPKKLSLRFRTLLKAEQQLGSYLDSSLPLRQMLNKRSKSGKDIFASGHNAGEIESDFAKYELHRGRPDVQQQGH